MDPAYRTKKIVDLSEQELIDLGFLGDDVAPHIKTFVEKVRANPAHLGTVTCLTVDCLKRSSLAQSPQQGAMGSPTPHPISEAEILYSQLSNDPDALTVVPPNLVSKFEQNFWYHGISSLPPKLIWRSDIETNPFPIPAPGTSLSKIPAKTAHGVFRTPLNAVWSDVAPRILSTIKARGFKCSALQTVRFSTAEEGKEETLGPVVVWIAVHPNSTSAWAVRDATPDILQILADEQITDAVVEWYEGMVQRLVDVPLRRGEDNISPGSASMLA